jgi:hypothetical protein
MAPRLLAGLTGSVLLLAACSSGAQTLAVTRPTAPAPSGASSTTPTTVAAGPALTPWGPPPVAAPLALQLATRAYYDGAGPTPEDRSGVRPACLLVLPTALDPTVVKPVPFSAFNVFGEFVVRWAPASGRGTALTLSVLPPGDPTDRFYFGPAARVTTFADGSDLRTAPQHPRGMLLRVANENCEYLLQPGGALPAAADTPTLLSLRLIYAP